ncbi:hypothetical protein CDAR_476441 [Caerostris darwini]|uniref:Uncharacterized protein n=1 Tax=Caerostris darwini TaxID=1538125 RepID=A0AAV4NEJ6_9ARAC|nr:hypothetical protein CDAR_476441 [Caerostris darwini]
MRRFSPSRVTAQAAVMIPAEWRLSGAVDQAQGNRALVARFFQRWSGTDRSKARHRWQKSQFRVVIPRQIVMHSGKSNSVTKTALVFDRLKSMLQDL